MIPSYVKKPLISNEELFLKNDVPLSFWLDHFLDSRAEIHPTFELVFWKIEETQKSFLY